MKIVLHVTVHTPFPIQQRTQLTRRLACWDLLQAVGLFLLTPESSENANERCYTVVSCR